MERRVLLAISLSFLVLFVYQALYCAAPPPERRSGRRHGPAAGMRRAAGFRGRHRRPRALSTPGARRRQLPPVGAAGRRHRRARDHGRDAEGPRGLHQPRRAPAALDAEGLQERRGAAARSRPGDHPGRDLPLPFSLRVDDAADDGAAERVAVSSVGRRAARPSTRRRSRRRSPSISKRPTACARARRSRSSPTSFVVAVQRAACSRATQALNPTVEWGPASATTSRGRQPGSFLSPNYIYSAQAIFQTTDGDVERDRRHVASRPGIVARRSVPLGGHRRSLLHQRGAAAAVAAASRVRAGRRSRRARSPPVVGHYVVVLGALPRAARERALLLRPEAARRAAQQSIRSSRAPSTSACSRGWRRRCSTR